MDDIQQPYRTVMRLRVEPELLANVRWYFAVRGARRFDDEHAFGSMAWESDDHEFPWDGLGEVQPYGRRCKNVVPAGELGVATITPAEWFATGVPPGVVGPYPLGRCFGGILGEGPGVGGGECGMFVELRLDGRGPGVGGGSCEVPTMRSEGGGVGGGVCRIPPASIDCIGSGVGGGHCTMVYHGPPCALIPDAPDLINALVGDLTPEFCDTPWPNPVPLNRLSSDPCHWESDLYPWDCEGATGARWTLAASGSSWFLRLIQASGAGEGTYYFTAVSGWTGTLPKVLTVGAVSFRFSTLPPTLTLTS